MTATKRPSTTKYSEDQPTNNVDEEEEYSEDEPDEPILEDTHHFFFHLFTGYKIDHFNSYTNFTNWMHRPVDAAALGVFRMLYGMAMCIDIAEERGGSQMDTRYGEPRLCHFPLFSGITAFSLPVMGCVYLVMWLGAIGIMLGYRFRLSCLAYIVPYWYIYLLDKPAWNNHSYLFGLVGTMLLFSDANRYCSLDKYLQPNMPDTVPYWNYFLIKFQFFVLYFYAGLKKLTAEWLSGYAMANLSEHWVFTPFRILLSGKMIDLLVVHWFTAFFDFTIAILMTWEITRLLVTPIMIAFHLMNSRLFVIGMFPWVCLAEVPLFFGFSWPPKLDSILKSLKYFVNLITDDIAKVVQQRNAEENYENQINASGEVTTASTESTNSNSNHQDTKIGTIGAKVRTALILFYCALQLFLPYSHFITKGYNNWTGLYGYSWNMMVHSYDTSITVVKLVDNASGEVHYLDPYAFTQYDRWTKHADMAYQYAKCIESNLLEDYARDPKASPLTSTNFSLYMEVWCSMNGRAHQRVYDTSVDLLKAEWSPFKQTSWTLPLLSELDYLRPKLKAMESDVLAWSNYTDVIFIADFPGMTLDNQLSEDLTNVTLTILAGNVRYKSDDEDQDYFLTAGKSFVLSSGETHHITTIGQNPSAYFFTYTNKTMIAEASRGGQNANQKSPPLLLPVWSEFENRVKNYKVFLQHMANCLLYLLYDVPIPMEVRERN
uniref:Vitamin K-dependent gamma-carboxylase n=1 Tax=Zeugodacus cucurbitae TaxID=28588 RepID=A0A0A1WX33_ZEUCU